MNNTDIPQKFPELAFPYFPVVMEFRKEKPYIFDPWRKKFVVLSPEEWVRQQFLQYLVQNKNFPFGNIAVEKTISAGKIRRRCDAIIYDKKLHPLAIVECKSPFENISRNAVSQIAVYGSIIPAAYFILCNGQQNYCWKLNGENNFLILDEIPDYRLIEKTL